MTLWMGYDRAGLDAQYNLRAAVPAFQGDFDRWRRLSATARQRPNSRLDIPYGEGALEKLDLFPADAPGAPLHVFIHGGYWQATDRSLYSHLARGLNQHGVSVALPSYDLCPAVTLAEIVEQISAACQALWRARKQKIIVSGHSAGGHLAACMLAPLRSAVSPAVTARWLWL